MASVCSINHCRAKRSKKEPQISMHKLPANQIWRQQWINAIGEDYIDLTKDRLIVCSLHFEESAINRTLGTIRIVDGCVPTRFLMPKQRGSGRNKKKMVDPLVPSPSVSKIDPELEIPRPQYISVASDDDDNDDDDGDGDDNGDDDVESTSALSERSEEVVFVDPSSTDLDPVARSNLISSVEMQSTLRNIKTKYLKLREFNSKHKMKGKRLNAKIRRQEIKITKMMAMMAENNKTGCFDKFLKYHKDYKHLTPTQPSNSPHSSSSTREAPRVCRVCLASDNDARLVEIARSGLEEAYGYLVGAELGGPHLPPYACLPCASRLRQFSSFRLAATTAGAILTEAVNEGGITKEKLSTIDRDNLGLTSNLTSKTLDQDHIIIMEYSDEDRTSHILHSFTVEKVDEDLKEENVDFCDETFGGNASDSSCDIPIKDLKKTLVVKKPVKKTRTKEQPPPQPKIDRRRKPLLNPDLSETLFTILDLNIDEQIAEINKRQETANFKNSPYKCMECFKGFLDEQAFNTHTFRHSVESGEHKCPVCKINFKHHYPLRKHITAHHTQRFSCNSCEYVTTSRQTARLHELWHRGTQYQCPHCSDVFSKFTTYMGHIRIKHPSDFVCELCGYSFVSLKGIELHKKLKHRLEDALIPEDGPRCEECSVTFVSTDALNKHLQISSKHADVAGALKMANKPRKPRDTNTKKERNEAVYNGGVYRSNKHKIEGPMPCEQCGVELADPRAYHAHFRRTHPDKNRTSYPAMRSPAMCELCGRIFQSYSLLKDHMWAHTEEKPFKCELCTKTFRMKQRLVAHRRVHSQQRAGFPCSQCHKTFTTQSNRQRHMSIHTGLKPFKCEMCGKAFKLASEKRAHVTYVHLKKPWPKRARRRQPPTREGNSEIEEPIWQSCPEQKIQEESDKAVYYLVG